METNNFIDDNKENNNAHNLVNIMINKQNPKMFNYPQPVLQNYVSRGNDIPYNTRNSCLWRNSNDNSAKSANQVNIKNLGRLENEI